MSNVLDAISTEHRPVIEQELENRNPALFDELRRTEKPTNEQSDAVIDVLSDALMKTFGPDWVPNDYGLKIERAIDALNRPGMSGDSSSWKGWGHVR
ncbi:hypothetical protein, partial [Mycobacterium tuberculosis]|uniref:hypothetical protein n=6 Tax=Mycobacterium tuberculosis TaxID=1773 RepID=UPI001F1CEF36